MGRSHRARWRKTILYTIYLGADVDLLAKECDEGSSTLFVSEIEDVNDVVREHSAKPPVYSIGPQTGCGCVSLLM